MCGSLSASHPPGSALTCAARQRTASAPSRHACSRDTCRSYIHGPRLHRLVAAQPQLLASVSDVYTPTERLAFLQVSARNRATKQNVHALVSSTWWIGNPTPTATR